ncbi:hypothetical protein CCUG60884_04779 [Mycobacteroides salmoniphilum]|uniref:Uncharacterized protein n=1 Tax=Mycobacteroides salmoniphilum TaxID=404941 RepID=A0A4V3I0G2_9MYCO|nr:hypothetical protein CCUG60884_04779 [Mycobacteroides salmoniphilum]
MIGFGAAAIENALLAKESDEFAAARVGVEFVVGHDVAHTGFFVVSFRAAQGGHIDVFTGHAAHHIGSGDKYAAFGGHDDDIGERGAVGGAAGGEADHDRDLWDVPGGADHGLKDQPDRVQGRDSLGQARPAGVPDTHDGALFFDRGVVGVHDVPATLDTHGPAHDGAVGAKGDGPHSVDRATGSQHTRAITLVQQLHSALIKKRAQPQQRITRIERFVDSLGSQDRHREPRYRVGVGCRTALSSMVLSRAQECLQRPRRYSAAYTACAN